MKTSLQSTRALDSTTTTQRTAKSTKMVVNNRHQFVAQQKLQQNVNNFLQRKQMPRTSRANSTGAPGTVVQRVLTIDGHTFSDYADFCGTIVNYDNITGKQKPNKNDALEQCLTYYNLACKQDGSSKDLEKTISWGVTNDINCESIDKLLELKWKADEEIKAKAASLFAGIKVNKLKIVEAENISDLIELLESNPNILSGLIKRRVVLDFASSKAKKFGGGVYNYENDNTIGMAMEESQTSGNGSAFVKLVTHEMGHALLQSALSIDMDSNASSEDGRSFLTAWNVLKEKETNFLGVKIGELATLSRQTYQQGSPNEFCAELFMLSALHDSELTSHYNGIQTSNSISREVKDSWKVIMGLLSKYKPMLLGGAFTSTSSTTSMASGSTSVAPIGTQHSSITNTLSSSSIAPTIIAPTLVNTVPGPRSRKMLFSSHRLPQSPNPNTSPNSNN